MKNNTFLNEPWLKWAIDIQRIAQAGIEYTKDIYDKERYEMLRDIAAEMISFKTEIPKDKVYNLFCNEKGYQTPKIDTRGAVFKDGKILLVHENTGKWSLPGGWCDVLESVASNTVKEVREESGYNVKCDRVIAIHYRNKRNKPLYVYGICKIFVQCELIDGGFVENIETTEAKFFGLNELPELDEAKCTKEQVKMCFDAYNDPNWKVILD